MYTAAGMSSATVMNLVFREYMSLNCAGDAPPVRLADRYFDRVRRRVKAQYMIVGKQRFDYGRQSWKMKTSSQYLTDIC